MFREAVLRLTLWYLLLIMSVSVGFSTVIYGRSAGELRALESRQMAPLEGSSFYWLVQPEFNQLNKQHIDQIENSRKEIGNDLLWFNLVILIGGGAAAYLLARTTLRPIETSLEVQTRFAADASHELRTPLTAIKTELEVALRDTQLTLTESKELHLSTLDEIAKLEALATGLLTLTRTSSEGKATFEQCSLQAAFDQAVSQVKIAASTRKITIMTEPTNITLQAECWSLTELLVILLDNAVKYSPEGSEVRLSANLRSHAHQVAISVEDHGLGISKAELPKIFDRFYRADPSRSKKVAGYGLGLSIAKKIVERHRGSLEVKSAEGVGSTFTALLPIKQ